MSDEYATTASDGATTVARSVGVQNEGMIVTLNVTTETEGETSVRVTDELPARVDPNEVGFHPDHAPEDGTAATDGIVFAGEVTTDDPLAVAYGAYFDTSDLDGEPANAGLRISATTRVSEPESSFGGGITGFLGGLFGGSSDEEPDVPDDRAGGAPETDSFEELDESAVEEGTDEEAAEDEAAAEEAADDEQVGKDADETPDVEEPEVGLDEEPEAAVAEADADETEPAVVESDTAVESDEGEAGGVAAEGSVAAALAAELEAGDVDEDVRETLTTELEAELAESQVARLDRVQKRTDDLRAYVEPLRSLLDEEGRPTEVVADLRDEIRSVSDEIHDEVEAELAELSDRIAGIDASVKEAAAERAAMSDELDATATELAKAREELASDLDAIREEVTAELERVERQTREGRRDIAADVDELREVAAQVESLRDALSSAFDVGGSAGIDAGTDEETTVDSTESDTEPDVAESAEADEQAATDEAETESESPDTETVDVVTDPDETQTVAEDDEEEEPSFER